MQVGELFINVGMMGADKLAKGLESANKSLTQIKETGLESAFRLKSVFGQFEEQVSTFSNMGTVLKVFEDQTGFSAVTLQKFQKAFMGVNVSADETRATMVNLQNIMNTIQRGGAVPAAMSEALRRMNIDITQIKDVPGFIEKMTKVSKTMDVGVGRDIAKDLGMSGTFWQGMRDYSGDFAKEQAWLNESQVRASAKMNAKVNLLRADIEASFAKLIATPSASKALDAIAKIINAFIKLLDATMKIANQTGLLDVIEKIFVFFGDMLTGLIEMLGSAIKTEGKPGKNAFLEFEKKIDPFSAIYSHFAGEHPLETMFKGGKIVQGLGKEMLSNAGNVNNVTVNQNISSPDPHTAGKKATEGFVTATKNISTRVQK